MLEVNGDVVASLKLAPMSEERLDELLKLQNPPREWHKDKLTRFLGILHKQLASVPPR